MPETRADIIVNTDGDGQYSGSDIPRLVEPVLAGRCDLVIGDRQPAIDARLSALKRFLQRLGKRVVSWIAGQPIADPVSGFRAFSRAAACRLHLLTDFSYTIETVPQAATKGMAIEFVPIATNATTRQSRLMRNIPQFVCASGLTILRVTFRYRPMAILVWAGSLVGLIGLAPIIRFLWFWSGGSGVGHIQSLVLGGTLIVTSTLLFIAALMADLMATNRKLFELTLERMHDNGAVVGRSRIEESLPCEE